MASNDGKIIVWIGEAAREMATVGSVVARDLRRWRGISRTVTDGIVLKTTERRKILAQGAAPGNIRESQDLSACHESTTLSFHDHHLQVVGIVLEGGTEWTVVRR